MHLHHTVQSTGCNWLAIFMGALHSVTQDMIIKNWSMNQINNPLTCGIGKELEVDMQTDAHQVITSQESRLLQPRVHNWKWINSRARTKKQKGG